MADDTVHRLSSQRRHNYSLQFKWLDLNLYLILTSIYMAVFCMHAYIVVVSVFTTLNHLHAI